MISQANDANVRPTPLEMIEGIESHDVLRLDELGVDTCYDLATADFVPLLLKTPYSGRQLIDWILQAKLCVYFGEGVKELRRFGIRTIVDLEALTAEEIATLPQDTSVTATVLVRAIAPPHQPGDRPLARGRTTARNVLGPGGTGEVDSIVMAACRKELERSCLRKKTRASRSSTSSATTS